MTTTSNTTRTKPELDTVAPGRQVYLARVDAHSAVASTALLDAVDGITEAGGDIDIALHGRRLYELMADFWPHVPEDEGPIMREFGELWTAKPKYVFSRTLTKVEWNSTLISENAVEEVRRLKAGGDGVMEVGGASLASALIPHGLIDEYQLFVAPIILGGGTPMFPALDKRIPLRLVETRPFKTVVMHRYVVD